MNCQTPLPRGTMFHDNSHISLLTFCTKMKVNSSKRQTTLHQYQSNFSYYLLERSQQKTTAIQVHSNVKLEEEEEKKPEQNSSTDVTNIHQSLAQVKAMSKRSGEIVSKHAKLDVGSAQCHNLALLIHGQELGLFLIE